ncbi:unnamed protein product [Rotaria socialis]|uniref:Uncharacterized protein n=1 Tax=Rotaria socialis TaxID=392032 RepID=A0A820DLN0_9BILA|nr:unnamed protein product [Rotaria socialis]
MEGQCLRAKLPDTANVAIQIEDTQVHEQHATTQNGLTEKSIRIISKCSLNQEILERSFGTCADLGLLATVGPRTMHVYDKLCAVVLSTDSGKIRDSNKIMLMIIFKYTTYYLLSLNQLINYFDPRSEYILVIIIEWSTKFSISIARIISANIQCSSRLLNARRCENFDDYSQQVD